MVKERNIFLLGMALVFLCTNNAETFIAQSKDVATSFNNVANIIVTQKPETPSESSFAVSQQELPALTNIYKQALLASSDKAKLAQPLVFQFLETDFQNIKVKQGQIFYIVLPHISGSSWNFDAPTDFISLQASLSKDQSITYEFKAVTQGSGSFFLDNIADKKVLQSKIVHFKIVEP